MIPLTIFCLWRCSRDILLCAKSSLTNGAVHSGCNEIKLLFYKDADVL